MIFGATKPLRFDDTFTTGKYSGKKVCVVMAKDIGYLWFMQKQGVRFHDNVNRCLIGIKKDNKSWKKSK